MAINKVVLGERTLIDLSLDTATEADVAKGKYFHRADGEIVEGTLEGSGGGGGGGGGVLVESDVNFYDYDGTLLYAYPRAGVMAMTELPESPAHEGLTFQEWNWTLEEIQDYDGPVNVGATYITDDGKTRFYVTLEAAWQTNVQLYFCIDVKGDTVVINWGDGAGDETYEIEAYDNGAYNRRNPRSFSHTYADIGDYVITVDSGKTIDFGYYGTSVLNKPGGSTYDHAILRRLELGKNAGSINTSSLNGSVNLEYITMPKGTTTDNPVGGSDYFFTNCFALKSITIPRGFYCRESLANGCYSLKSILFAGNHSGGYIPKNALNGCYSLSTLTIPSNSKGLREGSLAGTTLGRIHFHKNLTSIEKNALYNCHKLSEAILPSVTTIGETAFSQCYALRRVELGDGLTSIGTQAFYQCFSLENINVPSSVKSIGSGVFQGCARLQYVDIPNGAKISNSASLFRTCNLLIRASLPADLTSIGAGMFCDCRSLEELKMPSGVTSIGNEAFYGCYNLTALEIPSGVTSIGQKTFQACKRLTALEIPSSVTSIGQYAFSGCSSLESINIPDGVTTLNGYTFQNCSKLITIEIPSGVTSMGSYEFAGCSSLESINIPDGVTTLQSRVFSSCKALTDIEIPASVAKINANAFDGCSSLAYIDFSNHTSVPTLSATSAFSNTPADMEIRVPAALYDEWIAATNWSNSSIKGKIVAV